MCEIQNGIMIEQDKLTPDIKIQDVVHETNLRQTLDKTLIIFNRRCEISLLKYLKIKVFVMSCVYGFVMSFVFYMYGIFHV